MAVVRWSSVARHDLRAIRDYFENSSPAYARTIIGKLFASVSNLETFPRMGRQVPEIENEAFRELIVENYRVVYFVTEEDDQAEVELLTIAHSRQDLSKKLSRRR